MHAFDWAIVCAYLAYMIWTGARLSRRSGDTEAFFLAKRSLPWWAVGLSVIATQMSAITLIGTTGQAYAEGMRFIQFYFGLPLAMIVLCVTAVPLFYRAKVFTAYEYLERRFDARTRTLTSFFFLVSRGLGVGVIIAAPSVVLSVVLGWDEVATIFVIGLSTTLYTLLGGVRAVTWTDVRQMIVILIGLAACVAVIVLGMPAGVAVTDGLHLAGATGRLETIDLSTDLSERYTLWSGFIAALFLFLAYFGCDQSQVQRYLSARSIDEGRWSLLMSAFLKIPIQFLILLLGVLVFVYYQFQPAPMIFNDADAARAAASRPVSYAELEAGFERLDQARRQAALQFVDRRGTQAESRARGDYISANEAYGRMRVEALEFVRETNDDANFTDVNYVFPTFVLRHVPTGLVGLIVAAILAAAMSSVAAELSALSTASTMDFYRRFHGRNASEQDLVRFGRIATACWGAFACVVATFATDLGSLIEVVNRFGSFFYGSLLGVFVLAFAVPQAVAAGAFYGLLFGIVAVWLASAYSDIAFLWFNVVGCLVTVAAGYAISLAARGAKQ